MNTIANAMHNQHWLQLLQFAGLNLLYFSFLYHFVCFYSNINMLNEMENAQRLTMKIVRKFNASNDEPQIRRCHCIMSIYDQPLDEMDFLS